MVACDTARAPLMLVIPVLHWSGVDAFAALVALAFLLGAFGGPYFAAQKVIVPELLGEDEALVGKANALFQGATRITLLLGPVAGGVLIAALDAPTVLVVDAATYVVSAVLLVALVPRPEPLPPTDEDLGVRRGLRFLVREPLLRLWIPVFAFGDTAWTAFFVSVPVLVVARFDADPRVAGWLLASFGVGAVVGNVVAYRFLLHRVSGLTLIGTFVLAQALPLWLLTAHPPAWAISGALAVSGLANGLVNPPIHTLMTLRVPPRLRPTVLTVNVMIFGLAQPLGVFGVGPVLDAFGPQPVLVAFAAVQTVAMLAIAASCFAARSSPRLEASGA
jgi:predicted MFS family arabinose efflux permease